MRDEGSAVQVMNIGVSDFVLRQREFRRWTTWRENRDRLKEWKFFSEEATVSVEMSVPELDLEQRCADAHIQVVIDILPPELNLDQQTAAKKFIRDHWAVFEVGL